MSGHGNRRLIGQPGSKALLDTPALVIDLDAFEHNLRTMHDLAARRGTALRPHAKTHKCATIGRLQLEAGAIGLCCAKLGEAEALAEAGLEGLLLTSPITGAAKVDRLMALQHKTRDLAVVVDDPDNVAELARATLGLDRPLRLLIDVDVGTHRFGVTGPGEALALAAAIRAAPGLELLGVQGYAGHTQAIVSYAERRAASHAALAVLGRVRDALVAAGHACPIVTGSGTGTCDFDHEVGLLTDLQVGSYIFQDVIYDGIEQTPEGARRFRPALFVLARVVSRRHAGLRHDRRGLQELLDGRPAAGFGRRPDPGLDLRPVRRRVRQARPHRRRPPGRPRRAHDLAGAALRPHLEPLRPLPLRARP
jgi:3-hydroxy-D-aspartate aldolase